MDNSIDLPLFELPYHQDILHALSRHVIRQHRDTLPDLSQVTILLSNIHAATALRQCLQIDAEEASVPALLGPQIFTLHGYIEQQPLPQVRIINDHARELMLVEALLEFPHLYRDSNPWMLAANLMALFDDLTRQHIQLPQQIDDFIEQLGQAYGLPDTSHSALGMEATLVHTLWCAMQQQLHSLGAVDRHTAHIMRLTHNLRSIKPGQHFVIAGLFDFSLAEIQWLNTLLSQNQLTVFTQTDGIDLAGEATSSPILTTYQPWMRELHAEFCLLDDTKIGSNSNFYHQCFAHETEPLLQRATTFSKHQPDSPVQTGLQVFTAANAEEEAHAIDVQIRQWLIQGRQRIAVVTDNRRLARRLRALLERADIILQDTVGWALSTTSAATVVERWLECLEQDFHYQALLDFLKSPFVCLHADKEQHLTAVYRLEQGVVQHENVASNLKRYRQHTGYRLKRVSADDSEYYDGALILLERLDEAAATIQLLLTGQHHPLDFITALQQSLDHLQVWQALSEDEAGQRILEELQQLKIAGQHITMPMDWQGFRTWLGTVLERYNFQPAVAQQPVQLLGILNSDLLRYDGVIIAAAEQEYLPGKPALSPFFNDAVRTRLGLPNREQQLGIPFRHFRRLLESPWPLSATNTQYSGHSVLITRRHAEHDEEIIASPWLAAIETFHLVSYGNALPATELRQLINDPRTQITQHERRLPQPLSNMTASHVPPPLIPSTISASAYQQLLDCPYQFFAARCLQLKPPERVREILEKDDYGNRIHLCLQAFHGNVPNLPGPFKGQITEANQEQALHLLQQISEQVFSRDIEDNFQHRGWLKHWLSLTPKYIDWQMKRNNQWLPDQSECELRKIPISDSVLISGILDRIDRQADQFAIIDYKTGYVPKQDDIDSGEAIQLPYYALLATRGLKPTPQVQRVEYVTLSSAKVGTQGSLEDEQLQTLGQQVGERLQTILHELYQGTPVTAWGDNQSCQYCNMSGLCRKDLWQQITATQNG